MMDWRFLYHRYLHNRRTFNGFRWEFNLDGPLDNEMETAPYILWGGSTFLDVGACIGRWSLPAAHGIYQKVIAFEPSTKAFKILKHHVRMNHLDNVVCENAAISDKDGIGSLFSDGVIGHDSLRDGNSILKGVPVQMWTIDWYYEQQRMNHDGFIPSLIKIDTEGAELKVVKGAMRTINSFHPKLVIEIHDIANEAPIRSMLTDYTQRVVTGAEEPDGRIGRWLMCGYPENHWDEVDKQSK